jgi:hypothetical protein
MARRFYAYFRAVPISRGPRGVSDWNWVALKSAALKRSEEEAG